MEILAKKGLEYSLQTRVSNSVSGFDERTAGAAGYVAE